MKTLNTPIIDQFDLLLALLLSHDLVSLSKQELINTINCVDSWQVSTIKWSDYVAVEYFAAIKMSDGPPEKIAPKKVTDDHIVVCWPVYLRHKHGKVACILNLEKSKEAKLITESIQRFYFD